MHARLPGADRSLSARASAAGTWDTHAARYRGQEYLERRAIDVALRVAAPAPQERVVDLATGTGLLLLRLLARPVRPRVAAEYGFSDADGTRPDWGAHFRSDVIPNLAGIVEGSSDRQDQVAPRYYLGSMRAMKLSVSLSEQDVALLDEYARESGLPSRSAALQHAVRLLCQSDLQDEYATAWEEWESSGDAAAWEDTVGDGVSDAPR